ALYHDGFDPEITRQLHAEGIGIWAWTVNDAERMKTLASWGADAVCTDDPELGVSLFATGDVTPIQESR
ncbi:MAG TPA: glycerophosphodiester phosphodiesterase family protein, partial [Thermomicrobiales bacterium]|nr:glycerophosphodiester phosphodiesterase family protein [Thermomicrobiales bacterium]